MTQSTLNYNHVQRSAWLTLLAFFGLFCVLVAVGGFFGWRFYTSAMVPVTDTLLLRYATSVLIKEPDLATAQDISPPELRLPACQFYKAEVLCKPFSEGQRLVGKRDAGYGPVAAIKLPDQSLINLHTQPDGFIFGLKKYQVSRWTKGLQNVVFEQLAGYARYDLAGDQPYERVSYTVEMGEDVATKLFLAAGGSYSVDVPRWASGEPRGRLIDQPPILFEVAVRTGSATLESAGQSLSIRPGEKVQVALDGTIVLDNNGQADQDAFWELLPDGDFSAFTTELYNTPAGTDTWSIGSNGEPNVLPGEFSVVRTCAPDVGLCG
ncbi:MAG: hypothetical protein H7Z42_18450, partial [Roseiflexaceae bacterium]|nr:hypothetical protein [Roseiflexaceae bacterium]